MSEGEEFCYYLLLVNFRMVDGGGPVPSGLGQTVRSTSHNQQREGRHPFADEIRWPPPGQATDSHSCALL